ncbi:MAG: flagellar hook-length control protein FliK [Methylotenera sp.]
MFKPIDSSTVLPVAKVLPILAVDKIGDTLQTLTSRANQFLVGQEYQALVTAKASDGAHLVEVDGKLLKMELGTQVTKGQMLTLRFMQENPTPTFYLVAGDKAGSASSTDISQTGYLLGSILKQAESEGAPVRYQATSVVTQVPNNPHQVTQDLKLAIQNSGLFYEAHLGEVVTGKRTIESMQQELQHVANTMLSPIQNTLPAQQLAMLENQRLSWHGEIWHGQTMDWDVYQEQDRHASHDKSYDTESAEGSRPIFSEITLHLPQLGKVSARVCVADGRVQVNLLTENVQTLETFKRERQQLFVAMTENGQSVEALTVGRYE